MSKKAKNLWPLPKKVVESVHPSREMWSKAIRIPVGVPESLDKIKENCEQISRWWLGTRFDKKQIDECIINDTLDFDCVKKIFSQIAESIDLKPAGSGQYGATFMACHLGQCDYVLKIQMADDSFKREVYALYDLNGWEYSPAVYDAWTCSGVGFIVLEKMQSLKNCVGRLSKADIALQINTMIKELREKEWFHIDIKAGNTMCKNGHLALIDFGMAVKIPKGPLKYVLGRHPTVSNPKKPLKREDLLEVEDEFIGDTINAIYDIVSKPKKDLKKAMNVVRTAVKLRKAKKVV